MNHDILSTHLLRRLFATGVSGSLGERMSENENSAYVLKIAVLLQKHTAHDALNVVQVKAIAATNGL